MKLYIFNPEHDLALANGNENYVPPKSAIRFAACNEMLPARYAPAGALILMHDNTIVDLLGNPVDVDLSQLEPVPWGWDKAVVKRLRLLGLSSDQLPSLGYLEAVRKLSHRQTAIEAMAWLGQRLPFVETEQPVALQTMDELEKYLFEHGQKAIFKAPWSGSGKGIVMARSGLTDKQMNRCERIIASQGCIIAEHLYDVKQDFAMEFWTSGGKVDFLGYSMFSTHNGAYVKNDLMYDWEIERHLARYVSLEWLRAVREAVMDYLKTHIATVYDGPIGVDMFVYDDGRLLLNPMVEINLRFTMGMAQTQVANVCANIYTGSFENRERVYIFAGKTDL